MKRLLLILVGVVIAVVIYGASVERFPWEAPPPAPPTETIDKTSPSSIGTPPPPSLEKILQDDPFQFLVMSLEKYEKEVKGYSLIFDKRERIGGKLQNPEKVEVFFREKPFSVHMHWLKGAGLATKVLFVEGENDGKMLARGRGPLALLGPVPRDVDGADAKRSGRFTIAQFGFKKSTERTLASMKKAKDRGALHLRYEGLVSVAKLGDESYHMFVRAPYDPPEEDGLKELTIFFDTKNWFQVGSILKDDKGELISEYYFTEVKTNPQFDPVQFQKKGL